MFEKVKLVLLIIISTVLLFFTIPFSSIKNYVSYALYAKDNLIINLTNINSQISTISSDSSNKVTLKVQVSDVNGNPVSKAHVTISEENNMGTVYPNDTRTDSFGECLVTYIPPEYTASQIVSGKKAVKLSANIYKTDIKASINLNLCTMPVVFIHGYQENPNVFDNISKYLSSEGYVCSPISYNSNNGVSASTAELAKFLKNKQLEYLARGIQIKRFNLIAHSMGGLVARYYTCSREYISTNNVSKMVFVSVPQNGSHLASIGQSYFNDKGIQDLVVDSHLFKDVFPSLINKGLNHRIQVSNIIDQYDEVVSIEDASLEEWNIKTEIFNIGDNNYSVDNLIKGSVLENQNHVSILNNRKVFERVREMLEGQMVFPAIRK